LAVVSFGDSNARRVGDLGLSDGEARGQGFSVSPVSIGRGNFTVLSGTYDDYIQTDAGN